MADFTLTVDGHPLVVQADLQLQAWDYVGGGTSPGGGTTPPSTTTGNSYVEDGYVEDDYVS